ncbi:MAG TPA: hypothetical protein VNA15_00520 [Candidatus Angelobacter sp.]|nr:hypothetical protein [Candidatus Angelobacter sp.]
MTDFVAVIPDTVIVIGAAVFAVRCFSYAKSLKTGFYSHNFMTIGVASILLVIAEVGHLAFDAGLYQIGELAHDIIEAAFVIVLAFGVSKFFPSWMPKA